MDVVYACRAGVNEELRFSLRSLRNIEHDRVFIFGAPPRWVTGVTVVPVRQALDEMGNVRAAALSASWWPRISDSMIWMNDDFFAMRPTSVPTAHIGPTRLVIEGYRQRLIKASRYVDKMTETNELLIASGIADPLCYDVHLPMVMNRRKLNEILLGPCGVAGMHFRSYYGNTVGEAGIQIEDVKVGEAGIQIEDVKVCEPGDPIPRGDWLSCNDETFRLLRPMLEETFPDPGPYESGPDRSVTVGVLI